MSRHTDTRVRVFSTFDRLAQAAAEQMAAVMTAAIADRGRCLVALSGGSTPPTVFRLLAQPPLRDQVDWTRGLFFWGDERCVPPDHPESNYRLARETLLAETGALEHNIHRVRGELDPQAAADDYAGVLRRFADAGLAWPRLDLAIMGLGGDGHTASLFPGPVSQAERESPVLAVEADYGGRPAQRVTLTPLVFNAARHVVFLVRGAAKAEALAASVEGPLDLERWPAQRLCPPNGDLTWLVDAAAASRLSAAPES